MIRHKFLLLAVFVMTLAVSCSKKTDDVSKVVDVSFPTIDLNGPDIVRLNVGATYTDQGAQLTDDITGATSDIDPVSDNVNTATPGLYFVQYSASNANGFTTDAVRFVAVTNVTGGVNVSGTYFRAATGLNCIITKVAEGVYKVQNPGGSAAGLNTVVYFVETSPGVFICPPQPTATDGIMSVNEIVITPTGASWKVDNPGYNPNTRTFTR
jgi:hypothetical protein